MHVCVPEGIVVEWIVTAQRCQCSQTDRVTEKDLRTSIRPHLTKIKV